MKIEKPYKRKCKECNGAFFAASNSWDFCHACRIDRGLVGKIKYSTHFKRLKKTIIKRDNNECQCCKRDYKLGVHHIDENSHNNKLDNLITLCNQCHFSLHHKYSNNKKARENLIQKVKERNFPKIMYGQLGVRLIYGD